MFTWRLLSLVLVCSFTFLQFARWSILPQFMDIYYHLHTAWGFIQAQGYSGWDFWQYAPVGRVHLYPPFFHLTLAGLLKLGFNQVLLAKLCETLIPAAFLFSLWIFVRRNYGERMAFFTLLALSSSYSFYSSLINNLPATLAMIMGLFSVDRFFKKQYLRAIILLALSFYTHIGVSWVFAIAIFIYGLFDVQSRKMSRNVFLIALALSAPVIFKQLFNLKHIAINLADERFLCEFKILDYLLAVLGLIFVLRLDKKYRLFLAIFLASLVFILYPYRFFSAQGYLPVIFLAASGLELVYRRIKQEYSKYFIIIASFCLLLFSPTILMYRANPESGASLKLYVWDSALLNMAFPSRNTRIASTSLWFPVEYLKAAEIIKNNSKDNDIVYSNLHFVGVSLASLANRPSANALFAEVAPAKQFDPFCSSKIIIVSNDDNFITKGGVLNNYRLKKFAESDFFTFYKNTDKPLQAVRRRAAVSFPVVTLIALLIVLLYKKYLT